MLVDENEVVRNSLKLFFAASEDLQLVGEESDGHEAISVCALENPDLLLMDINLPFLNGVEATRSSAKDVQHLPCRSCNIHPGKQTRLTITEELISPR